MVTSCFKAEGIAPDTYAVVPFPINRPDLLQYYAPPSAVYFMTIYDEWSEAKRHTLLELGLTVEIMWKRTDAERLTSGTEVRRLIRNGQGWEHLVPQVLHSQLRGVTI